MMYEVLLLLISPYFIQFKFIEKRIAKKGFKLFDESLFNKYKYILGRRYIL